MPSTIDDTVGASRAPIRQLNDRHPENLITAPLVAVLASTPTSNQEEAIPSILEPQFLIQEGYNGMSGSTHTPDSGDENMARSDGEAKSTQENNVNEDEEDEEEMLIMRGGSGIPIGSVSNYICHQIE